MQQCEGDIWKLAQNKVLCISTNGIINRAGALVMGKGIALEAKRRYPGIDYKAGQFVSKHGNNVCALGKWASHEFGSYEFVTFPVKTHWREAAKPELIKRSTEELEVVATQKGWQEIYIPHVGCANGGLLWKDVYPILNMLLDHRFIAVEQVWK